MKSYYKQYSNITLTVIRISTVNRRKSLDLIYTWEFDLTDHNQILIGAHVAVLFLNQRGRTKRKTTNRTFRHATLGSSFPINRWHYLTYSYPCISLLLFIKKLTNPYEIYVAIIPLRFLTTQFKYSCYFALIAAFLEEVKVVHASSAIYQVSLIIQGIVDLLF